MSVLELLRTGRRRIAEDTTYKVGGCSGVSLMEGVVTGVQEKPVGTFTRDEKEAMRLLAKFASEFDSDHHLERGIDLKVRRLAIYDSLIAKLEKGEGEGGDGRA